VSEGTGGVGRRKRFSIIFSFFFILGFVYDLIGDGLIIVSKLRIFPDLRRAARSFRRSVAGSPSFSNQHKTRVITMVLRNFRNDSAICPPDLFAVQGGTQEF
jgi:hypothetical protein